MHGEEQRVFLGLGSNIDRETNLSRALGELRGRFGTLRCSSIYEYPAQGFVGAAYFNLVVQCHSALNPSELRMVFKAIERLCGRQPGAKGPKDCVVDIDLLLVGDIVEKTEDYELPHPDIITKRYILEPLSELAPAIMHPSVGATFRQLFMESELEAVESRRWKPQELNLELGAFLPHE